MNIRTVSTLLVLAFLTGCEDTSDLDLSDVEQQISEMQAKIDALQAANDTLTASLDIISADYLTSTSLDGYATEEWVEAQEYGTAVDIQANLDEIARAQEAIQALQDDMVLAQEGIVVLDEQMTIAQDFITTLQDEVLVHDGYLTTLNAWQTTCLLYTSPSPRDGLLSRMPSSA